MFGVSGILAVIGLELLLGKLVRHQVYKLNPKSTIPQEVGRLEGWKSFGVSLDGLWKAF